MSRPPFIVPAGPIHLGHHEPSAPPMSMPWGPCDPTADCRPGLGGVALINALSVSPFKEFVQYAAHALQASEDLVLLNAFGAVNTAVNGKAEVVRRCGHREPVSLYIAIVADPGERKSAAVKLAKAPVHHWVERERMKSSQEGSGGRTSRRSPRLYFQDSTAPALKRVLGETEGRLSCHEPEPGLLDMLARSGNHLPLFCNGYDREPIVVDRVNRPPMEISAPAISLCISAQPEAALRFARSSHVRSSGMLARFLFVRVPSLAGTRSVELPPIPAHSLNHYAGLLSRLLNIPTPSQGEPPHASELDDDAEALFANFARWAECELRAGRSLSFDVAWGAKLPGKVLRLAFLIHCIERDDPFHSRIGAGAVRQAIGLADALTAHAWMLCWHAEHGEVQEAAEAVLRWASTYGLQGFSVQDAQAGLPRYARRQIQAAIDLLLQRRLVYEDLLAYSHQQERSRRGRPRAPRFCLTFNGGSPR
ncbi:YfjI family protein [Azospirillum argentinense]